MKYRQLFFLSILIAFLFSCSSTKKTVSSSLVKANGFNLPDYLPATPISEIDLQVKIPASIILSKMDSLVPKDFYSDNWPHYSQPSCDFRYKYHFTRSSLQITCINNKIGIQFVGNYQLSGSKCLCALNKPVSPWISGSCGYGDEPMRKISINISSQLSFLSNYKVRTQTKLENLTAFDKCVVSMFSQDVTGLVVDSVKSSVNSFCHVLDQTVAGMDFSKLVHDAMVKADGKTAISKYGYVSINPSKIRIGQINYIKDTFYLSVGASCSPQLLSDSSVLSTVPSIPPLLSSSSGNVTSLYLNANYDYSFLSKILNDTIKGKSFEVNGRTIVIKEAEIKGIGNHQMEIRVDFAGSNRGRIFLRGTPVLDATNQTLTVPDITYSLEGEDLALKIAKTVFKNKIKKNLQGKTYLDIGAMLKTNMPFLNSKINNQFANNIYSNGHINEVKVIGLLALDNSMQMQVYINANVSLIGTGMP